MKQVFKTQEETEKFVNSLFDEDKYVVDIHELPASKGFEVQWIEKKTYISYDGDVFPDEVWVTESGDMKFIQDLEPEHAKNIIRMIIRDQRKEQQLMQRLSEKIEEVMNEELKADEYNVPVAPPYTLH